MAGLSDNTLARNRIEEEAIAWHLRLANGSGEDWVEFADWLDRDPLHNAVYEAVCDADLALEPAIALAQETPAATDEEEAGFTALSAGSVRRWKWPALAASVALAAMGTWAGMGGLDSGYTVRTAPGETRTFALADGTRITLNGATEITLDKSDTRTATLQAGEAQFTVHHDAERPFTLTVGDRRIVDVGTVFNVRAGPRVLRVQVAEGAVRFEDGVTRLRLGAGDTLDAGEQGLVEGSMAASDIGGWTRGRLVYRDAPLVEVAADLTRARGMAVELGPDLSNRRFSGVIQLDGDDPALQKRIGTLLDVKVTASADGWSITR